MATYVGVGNAQENAIMIVNHHDRDRYLKGYYDRKNRAENAFSKLR